MAKAAEEMLDTCRIKQFYKFLKNCTPVILLSILEFQPE
jgi:hypothetical protein